MADLMRAITIPCRIDFMAVSSYGSGTKTSGVVKIIKDLDIPLEGYDLLIVEDILDSGMTLSYILDMLKSRGPRSIQICTLLDKPERRKAEVKASYVGTAGPGCLYCRLWAGLRREIPQSSFCGHFKAGGLWRLTIQATRNFRDVP